MLQMVMRPAMPSVAHRRRGIFDDVARAPAVPILPMMASTTSFAVTPKKLAVDGDAHVAGRVCDRASGREHMLDFRSADTEGEGSERAVGRRMAVTADDGVAGQREALFRADDVDDALADVVHIEQRYAEILAVLLQRFDLNAGLLVLDALGTVCCRDVVIGHGQGRLGAADGAVRVAQAFESLGAGDLMNEMAVDINESGAVLLDVHQMLIPYLIE